ncbi:major facilitator transporter [Hydrogenophaga taeniospiralis CCUG 15921]|uniref:Major facilitator transporter n=1 Tax=Hydrogenophaga taeniospiralis CCUG 15921 TaxID=1281780 RepID=A0A9X4NXK4_9BURK|nr:MFS transporter [Hydrogenophaga taeniospiralis]MDG5978506.1 major facilitator transporter [Hydrogenophaga taeniospiralis CCUG 15921]
MNPAPPAATAESPYAWFRLVVSLALMTLGGAGMYAVTVVLPRIQADFDVARGDASLPYTLTMVGFGLGGILMGRLSDRFGVMVPVLGGAVGLGLGFIAAGAAQSLWQFSLAQGLLIGLLGTSATFAPLVADTSRWFTRRRGIALAICMSGNYLAGAVWPPVIQYFIDHGGWRQAYTGIGAFCLLVMLPLALVLRRRPPAQPGPEPAAKDIHHPAAAQGERPLGLSPGTLQALLCVAGVSCCVAMSMPQVHIVAYCTDLGFGAARGAEMLSVMLGMGIASRLISGWISDHIGGLRTLLLGSVLQGVALLMFLPFDGLVPLYLISGMFGLFQGGIVPSYALIVREHFSPAQAGARVGTVLMATLLGMALGGWMSGAIFDLTGSYQAAFLNGIAFNLLNIGIVLFLLKRARGTGAGHARARVAPI